MYYIFAKDQSVKKAFTYEAALPFIKDADYTVIDLATDEYIFEDESRSDIEQIKEI